VYALGILARPPLASEAAIALASALADARAEVRVAAATVLGALRVESAGDALIEAMNDAEADVRRAAMRALGDIREARALRALSEHLAFYKKGSMAEAALDGLARLGHPSSLPVFEQYASDKDALLRRRAFEGLARVGRGDAIARFEGTLTAESSKPTALALAFALHRGGRPGLDRLVSGLIDRAVEAQAMSYLVELGPGVGAALGVRLQDPDPEVRERLAMVLGMLGGPDALAALERATRDPEVSVQRAAERGIARIRQGR
jgi:HEAT repeat protein